MRVGWLRGATSMSSPPIVCLFTRPVVAGLTKTRLIPCYGAGFAADLARAFLLDTFHTLQNLAGVRLVVALSESGSLPTLAGATTWPQGSGNLGDRMGRVARRALGLGAPWVLIVGSDAPGLPLELLEHAKGALDGGAPAAIGPTRDGGYCFIGLGRCPDSLLRGIEWSTERTFDQTVRRLTEHGMAPTVTAPWFDVDVPADVEYLIGQLETFPNQARRTREVLGQLEFGRR